MPQSALRHNVIELTWSCRFSDRIDDIPLIDCRLSSIQIKGRSPKLRTQLLVLLSLKTTQKGARDIVESLTMISADNSHMPGTPGDGIGYRGRQQ